ncbi:MAG: hypothetical protein JXD22_02185 [Sedimentisphaerales bacterium]|nr:hypothetical protein [Sedimentisphaerales bacterium]
MTTVKITTRILILFCLVGWELGCQPVPNFPERAEWVAVMCPAGKLLSYDRDGDGIGDYLQVLDKTGRKVELRFGNENNGQYEVVQLDMLGPEVPHFIIALDGVPYELVEELYRAGGFRLFHRPSRLISCFPSMTDLAFNRLFGGKQPLAFEAEYFDRKKNRIIPGNDVYLSGANADWANKLDYRCPFLLDTMAYMLPDQVFDTELREIMDVLRKSPGGTKIVYSVGTAGLGTKGGRKAILKYLMQVDRLCEQIVYERKGKVKITLLADHGHNMVGRGQVKFDQRLKEGGYLVRDRLEGPRDVVVVKFGLVTYAALYTERPWEMAGVLLSDSAVELVCYWWNGAVMVQTLDGKAQIRYKNGRYSYQVDYGDPLGLSKVIEQLRRQGQVDEQGYIDDRAFFAATVEHEYPDALRRLWLAFNGLVEQPADLIVCLRDGWYHGSDFFSASAELAGGVKSTHGSLNRVNSTTFVLTMLGQLPQAMRMEDVMPQLDTLRNSPAK